MNREGIIIIICIGIVVFFYLFQDNTFAVEQVDLVKKPIVQSSDDLIKGTVEEAQSTTRDSLDNKELQGTQPK